jgi:hypothetical protein
MVELIQKLLQLAVIIGLIYVIVKPSVLPTNLQPIGYSAQRWIFGSEVSLVSAQATWQSRWMWLTTYIPPLAGWSKTLFSAPPQITSDGILQWFNTILWKQPAAKLEIIKQNLYEVPASSSSGLVTPTP